MRYCIAFHIPDRQSRVQIGFNQISPLASSIRDLATRLETLNSAIIIFTLGRTSKPKTLSRRVGGKEMVGSLLGFYCVILLAIIGVRFIIYLNTSYFKTCLPRSVRC